MNRLNAESWEILDISDLGDLKGVGDKDVFLMYRWQGAYIRVFDAQFLAPILKELHLLEESSTVTLLDVASVKVLNNKALIAEISAGGT